MSLQQFSTPPPTAAGPRRPSLRLGTSYSPLTSGSPTPSARSFSLPLPLSSSPTPSPSPSGSPSRWSIYSEKEKEKMDEKRSIDVPCIILTEPDSRSILVQPSTSLPLPLPLHSRCGGPDSSRESGWKTVWRTTAILAAVGLGIWHVWSVLGEFDLDLEA